MADFDPIWEIIQQAKAQMRQLGTFQWDATYPLPDDIRRDIQEGVGYVMCVDKQVAVYGVISFKGEPVYEQIADSWSNALPYVVVHRLAVADGMKRRGLAGQFMLRAEALSRREGIYGFRVDTKADNQYMLQLLESQGFRLCGKDRRDSACAARCIIGTATSGWRLKKSFIRKPIRSVWRESRFGRPSMKMRRRYLKPSTATGTICAGGSRLSTD